jgi:pyruvate/2-oxoglutarate/acetoin dehydrogenase E1 component
MEKIITYSEAIREALAEEMRRDKNVFLLGEDVGVYGGAFGVTKGLLNEFGPNRIIDAPISESAITGSVIGSAICGMRPVAEIMFMDFITVAMDQIVNHAAKLSYIYAGQVKVPIVIRTPAGAKGGYGASHSQNLEAWFLHVPGLKVVAPSTPYDAKGLLKSSIRDNNPVLFIENKLLYSHKGQIPEEEYLIPIGKAEVKKQGKDLTLVGYSNSVLLALSCAEDLEKEGKNIEVIDLRTLSPLDIETIGESVKKTGKAIIIEEGCKTGGVGAEIASQIMEKYFDYLDAPIKRIAARDVPIPCTPVLEDEALISKEKILQEIKSLT